MKYLTLTEAFLMKSLTFIISKPSVILASQHGTLHPKSLFRFCFCEATKGISNKKGHIYKHLKNRAIKILSKKYHFFA
jgi:hypothetical protein